MPSPFRRRFPIDRAGEAAAAPPSAPAAARVLAARMRYELVPVASVERAVADLPPGAPVSVTCSPSKGLPATLELTAQLLDRGHDAVPHLSARMVSSRAQVAALAGWIGDHGVREVFVIAGDAPVPAGPYADGLALLGDLLEHRCGIERIGVPAYPDGHSLIDDGALRHALHAKQALLASAGIAAAATTQMCFDAARVRRWLLDERISGLTMPVDIGVPGVVDRTRLMTMGVRLGVGASLRFLRKQRAVMTSMLVHGAYDPTPLVAALAGDAERLGIAGLHSFTFNAVAETAAWQHRLAGA